MTEDLAGSGLPPIVRDAQRLLLAVEQCVRNFPSYHKYQVGADLRAQAMQVRNRLPFMPSNDSKELKMTTMTNTFTSANRCAAMAVLALISVGTTWAQQVCNPNIALTQPDSRYETVAGATPPGSEVKDKVTGLVWKRCVEGMAWSGTACTGSYATYNWTQALDRARSASATTATPVAAWRLPNKAELTSLVETACYTPALNATWFPNQPVTYPGYIAWSSSPFAYATDGAWVVSLYSGSGGYGGKNDGFAVRLVRSGQ